MSITRWIDRAGSWGLRLSLAIVFIWFGALKLADLCPLAGFIGRSVPFLPAREFLLLLGCWEIAIGLCLLVRRFRGVGLVLLFLHLPGTTLPLIVIPEECFTTFPYALTVEGQYVIKNLVLASAGIALASRYLHRRQQRLLLRMAQPVARPIGSGKDTAWRGSFPAERMRGGKRAVAAPAAAT
jgi:uncharacterized membrane protein YkgB